MKYAASKALHRTVILLRYTAASELAMSASGRKRPLIFVNLGQPERPLSARADIRSLFAGPMAVGLLREQVLHRYAQYCTIVRECLPIDQ